MALISGTKLGPYEIQSPLGAGGMGEVYRARDTRLERTVAIKILPDHLSANHELKLRFEREARAISQLQHPHICVLYDVGSSNGTSYLVMEYLEGETLEDRLRKGPLPLDQLLKVSIEIANALDKAHRTGIIHRDLKPANIMLTKSGAKLMDFGLARGCTASVSAAAPAQSGMPSFSTTATLTNAASPLTGAGTILGTLNYMSPEQIEGKEADTRSDIFALGTVLYEMVTGRRAFEGKNELSVASAILEKEPEPISVIKPLMPSALDHVVRKCLTKVADERWQCTNDLASELKWIGEGGSSSGLAAYSTAPSRNRSRLGWTIAGSILGLSAGLACWPLLHQEPTMRPVVTALLSPAKMRLVVDGRNGPPAISPDGTSVAFIANDGVGQSIWIRSLETTTAKRLLGTEDAFYPFWSPDSRWIAFFASGKLRKVRVSGGTPQDICAIDDARGGSWGSDGTILLTPKGRRSEIYRVAENGGELFQVTHFQEGIVSHRWPYFLPDSKHFLYLASATGGTMLPNNQGPSGIRMASVDGKEDKLVLFASSNPEFADGWLLFVRNGTLMAVRMDASTGKVLGEEQSLPASAAYDNLFSSGAYSVSNHGILLYQSSEAASGAKLQWFSATGKLLGKLGSAVVYGSLRIAPEDKRVAVSIVQGSGTDMWVLDTIRNATTRVTFSGRVLATRPAWSPDGRSIAYSAAASNGKFQLFRKAADGTGEEEQVAPSGDRDEFISDWSPDGHYLLFVAVDPKTHFDIWAVATDGSQKPFPVTRGPSDEINGRFSPDGRWVAYVSDESGRNEIYLMPFQHGQGKWRVSTEGGQDIAWSRDGRALYYTSAHDDLWAIRVMTHGDTVEFGTPQHIFNTPIRLGVNSQFDVTREGRFLINSPGETADVPITLVQNWKALLNQ